MRSIMGDAGWKILFAVAAGFNFAVGLPLLIAPGQTVAAFGLAPQPTLLFVQFTGGLVAVFGLYYAVVAHDLARREIVWLGIVGKLFAVGMLTAYFLAGLIPALAYALGLGDLVFICLFLWFLFGGRKQRTQ
jgi:hypothetical protein